jgi:tetratricopeptide (TPR) repeat protein
MSEITKLSLKKRILMWILKRHTEKYYKKKKYDKAITELTKAINIAPNDSQTYKERGFIYEIELEDYKKALADYNQAITIDPDRAFTYYLRGEVYLKQNQAEAAIDDFDKAISLDKNDPTYYRARGGAYAGKGERNNAIADFREAIKLCNTDSDSILSSIADKCTEIREYQLAIDAWSECIKGDDDFFGEGSYYSYGMRAEVYKLQGNYEAAIADCTKVIQILSEKTEDENKYSGIEDAYGFRGTLYHGTGKYANAVEDLNNAINWYNKCTGINNNWLAQAHYHRGLAYKGFGDNAKAKLDFETAVRLNPDKAEYREELEKSGGNLA